MLRNRDALESAVCCRLCRSDHLESCAAQASKRARQVHTRLCIRFVAAFASAMIRRRQQALFNIDARVELVGILVAWLAVARDVYDAALQIGQVVVVRVAEAAKGVVCVRQVMARIVCHKLRAQVFPTGCVERIDSRNFLFVRNLSFISNLLSFNLNEIARATVFAHQIFVKEYATTTHILT